LIVDGVTDEQGANRAERHKKTYPKTASDQAYTIVKLADRIANMRESEKTSPGLLKMYRREYPEFRKALKEPWGVVHKYREAHGLTAMWAELDQLSEYGA
jgi:(p)ppGpp synthase/HD superfamily hydrolase